VVTVRKFTGSLGIGIAAMGSAVAVALSSATPALAANQALMLNGIGVVPGVSSNGGPLPSLVMDTVLNGMFNSNSGYQNTAVLWPNTITGNNSFNLTESVAQGVTNLDAALKIALAKTGPNEHVTIVGLSAGALVADGELQRLLADPNAPAKNKLNFVVVADSSRANFNKNRLDKTLNYQYSVPAQTKYDTIVVTAEYDGFADFPDRVWNIVAVANAYVGEILNHVPSVFTDLSTVPKSNVTVTTNSLGGTTTNYFIPAEHLPLVELLPFLAPQEAQLKQIVDAGYIRNDGKSSAATPTAAATAASSTGSAPVAVPAAATPAPAPAAVESAPEVSAPAAPVSKPAADQTAASESPVSVGRLAAAATGDAPQQTAHRTSTARAAAAGGHRTSPAPARAAAASRGSR
jgi:hypothetical protein